MYSKATGTAKPIVLCTKSYTVYVVNEDTYSSEYTYVNAVQEYLQHPVVVAVADAHQRCVSGSPRVATDALGKPFHDIDFTQVPFLNMCCGCGDAVDEDKVVLCCALCCINCGCLNDCTCLGCSAKAGLCCLNCEICCKTGAPCLPCCCCGPNIDCQDCSICHFQGQACWLVISAALPCNHDVPLAVSVLGLTVIPKCGCCVPIKDVRMIR